MNVIFTCGGTGGHINPAIAVANILKERHPDCNILFIGGKGQMEEELVPKAGYQLKTLPASGMSRKLNWAGIKHNFRAVKRILGGVGVCKKIIKEFGADVIIGTGGYVSFNAILAGKLLGIPTCVHESNAMPGLTTRLVADMVDRVLICFPESAAHYRHPEKAEVVGMPVRREFIFTKKEDARKELGLDERPVVVSVFGSQGARAMNLATAELFRMEQEAGFPFQHIHAVGSYGWDWMPGEVASKGVDLAAAKSIDMRKFIYNMPTVMAAADVVIARAGAATCNEIAATGTPCILIPSPNVTDNHQEKNARALEAAGGAVVLLESEFTARRLMEELTALLSDQERQKNMHFALQRMAVPDSAEKICGILESLASKQAKE
jgi:UDP-N-acetylglucosamine--N-acetylmuramyl-(pentapeptide) pyrophosphoryl-undecaprenol N-acetylglucosamine transferase